MPVIVVGADTDIGYAIVPVLQPASGEIRVFVSDGAVGERYRVSAKVAVGDVSDASHVGGAAIGAFCAIIIAEAAHDGRERSFATTPQAVFRQWADGLADAAVDRIIVVGRPEEIPSPNPIQTIGREYRFVETAGKDGAAIAAEVADLEAAPPGQEPEM